MLTIANKELQSPFQICASRIQRIVEDLFDDFDGLVYALHKDRFSKGRFIFGVVHKSGNVTTIKYELWRTIRTREWDESLRVWPLRGDELELVLHNLAVQASYTDRGRNPGWRLLEREDVT